MVEDKEKKPNVIKTVKITEEVEEDTKEKIDIKKLNEEIAQIVARENVLRAEIDKIIKEIEGE